MKFGVYVEVANAALKRAIERQIEEFEELTAVARDRCDVVVSTTRDSSYEACRELVARGKRVVVLAALPSAVEQGYYAGAGADYLPMGGSHLRDHLRRLVGRQAPIDEAKWPLDGPEGDHPTVAPQVAGRDSSTIRHEGAAPGTVR